jgi:sulfur relay (sulfurtransferase) complex TusBCD TusD component (DsrE family)
VNENPNQLLIITNDGPYGSKRAYNALRLAMNLAKHAQVTIRLFPMAMVSAAHIKGRGRPTDTTTSSG